MTKWPDQSPSKRVIAARISAITIGLGGTTYKEQETYPDVYNFWLHIFAPYPFLQ